MPETTIRRPLGTMITYGYSREHIETDLKIAGDLGASIVEVLPHWKSRPDPSWFKNRLAETPFQLHSAHGCWGGQSIEADRVDLGDRDDRGRSASVQDVGRCLDWLAEAGGRFLVVHPGGYSDPATRADRAAALADSLRELGERARALGLVVCVENMPPGVHPGSRMAELAELVAKLNHPAVGLALDTGHAHISASPEAETTAAGPYLRTTHVHDNNGRQDSHEPPGQGTLDWPAWLQTLDQIDYRGPIMLECIRKLREDPSRLDDRLLGLLRRLTGAA